MKTFCKLKGYWNYVSEYNFSEDRKWEGIISIDEDGWFEGLAKDVRSLKTTRMIFGNFNEEQGIYMYMVAPRNTCEPQIIRGTYNENGFDGEICAISFTGATQVGVSRIITEEISELKIPEDFKEQVEKVKEKTESTAFYNMLNNRIKKQRQYVKTTK